MQSSLTVGLSTRIAIANNFQVASQLLQCFPTDRKTQRYNLFLVPQRKVVCGGTCCDWIRFFPHLSLPTLIVLNLTDALSL